MTPEVIVNMVQLGATGLLALVLYFGLQANARMLEVLAEALKSCMEKMAQMEASRQKETD